MENAQNMNATGTQDNFVVKPLDSNERSRSRSDIMTRRLKNRERQRRYRARKRLEADTKKAYVMSQLATPQVEPEPNGNHNNYITRMPCKRNWKKDARRANACKNLEGTPTTTVVSDVALNIESQTVCLAPGIIADPPLERKIHCENSLSMPSSEIHKTKLGRRDWKAEARNKKN